MPVHALANVMIGQELLEIVAEDVFKIEPAEVEWKPI